VNPRITDGVPLAAHYERLAARFDRNWEYSDAFLEWMTGEIVEDLAPAPGNVIADIGAGTGLYGTRLLGSLGGPATLICMDPSAAMLEQVRPRQGVRTVVSDATSAPAALRALGYDLVDRILIKEAVHHFRNARSDLAGLAAVLPPGGRLLVAMLPPTVVYPLFQSALERFEALQPHHDTIAAALRDADLDVSLRIASFSLEIPCDRYREMVAERYLSLLSSFTDEELAAGLSEMDSRRPADGIYRFEDRFAFVSGYKGH
jgi:ubiquinone/menaquinone biosynthesis C-methylase UbiE